MFSINGGKWWVGIFFYSAAAYTTYTAYIKLDFRKNKKIAATFAGGGDNI